MTPNEETPDEEIKRDWFRPPFEIPAALNKQCMQFAGLCDKFFSICRALEINKGQEAIKHAAMICRDSEGWYIFGYPNRFPLTSCEINYCGGELVSNLDAFFKSIKLSKLINFRKPHPIFGKKAIFVRLGEIPADSTLLSKHIHFDPLTAIAIIPSENRIKNESKQVKELIDNLKMEAIPSTRLAPTRLDLMAKIAKKILSYDPDFEFDLKASLDEIARLVSDLLNVEICSIFLKESVLDYGYNLKQDTPHSIAGEPLLLMGSTGYDTKRINRGAPRHVLVENLRAESPAGITVSIVCDKLKTESIGKVVILNHRIEIGGYVEKAPVSPGEIDDRDKCRKDLTKILFREAKLRKEKSSESDPIEYLIELESLSELKKECDRIISLFKFHEGRTFHHPHWRGLLDVALERMPCRALLGIPIILDEIPIGCIKVEAPFAEKRECLYEFDRFTFQDMILLDCVASLIAIAIRTMHDREKLTYDMRIKTLWNKSQVHTLPAIQKLFPDNRKKSSTWSQLQVLFLDVDDFKSLNSNLGYLGADNALVELSKILCQHAPKESYVARFGGDEFYIVLPIKEDPETKNPHDQIFSLCDKIRQSLSNLIIESPDGNNRKQGMSVSFGCATGEKLDEAIRNASLSNRIAKWAGKNQLIFHEDISVLLKMDRKIGIIDMLSPKMAVINVGKENGVFPGLMFEVKHRTLNEDSHFEFIKAYMRIDVIYPKTAIAVVEQSFSDFGSSDEVIVRT